MLLFHNYITSVDDVLTFSFTPQLISEHHRGYIKKLRLETNKRQALKTTRKKFWQPDRQWLTSPQ